MHTIEPFPLIKKHFCCCCCWCLVVAIIVIVVIVTNKKVVVSRIVVPKILYCWDLCCCLTELLLLLLVDSSNDMGFSEDRRGLGLLEARTGSLEAKNEDELFSFFLISLLSSLLAFHSFFSHSEPESGAHLPKRRGRGPRPRFVDLKINN